MSKEEEVIKEEKEFFDNIVKALAAVCAANTKTGKSLPLNMTPYDCVFAVLGSENLAQKQKEIIYSPEFPKIKCEFVRGIKEGIVKEGQNKTA